MIRLLQGNIHSKEKDALTLLTNGVGYHIRVAQDLLTLDGEATLHIYTHVREDRIELFGFRNQNELNFFELLITVKGVGPKLALAILNEPAETIKNAIFNENLKTLTSIPGLGKKTAERMILELKSKVEPSEEAPQNPQIETPPDVIVTLESLGYKRHHISKVLGEATIELTEEEEIIRYFLQNV